MASKKWWIISVNCSGVSLQKSVNVYLWTQMVLDGIGILLHLIILICNLTSVNHCLRNTLERIREFVDFNPNQYYDDERGDEFDTSFRKDEILNHCDGISGGLISIGPIIIAFHIFSLFLSTFLLIGTEQRNLAKCSRWIRLVLILALAEFVLVIASMQIHQTKIILFGGFDCAYKIFGIWLVYRFTGNVDGYLGKWSTSSEQKSYDVLHSTNPAEEVLSAGPISLMDYHENMGKAGLGWS